MSPDDIVVLPYLINNFDYLKRSLEHDKASGERAIEIGKRINGVAIIATLEVGKDKQSVVTGWKTMSAAQMQTQNEPLGLYVLNDTDINRMQQDIEKIKTDAHNASKVACH